MIRRFLLYSILAVSLVSCSKKAETANELTRDDKPLAGIDKDAWTLGGQAFGIFHEVDDYNQWKQVFDQNKPARDKVGFRLLDILRDANNQNVIALFFKTPDHKVAKDYISDDLRQKMDQAGVVSVPTFIMYDLVYMTKNNYDSIPYRVGASYKVKNFDSWLEKFAANRESRKNAGLLDIGVARSPESTRMVYMMMATDSLEKGHSFIEEEGKEEKMSDYGVVGDPTFSLWIRADYNK